MADTVPATVIECRAAHDALARCKVPAGMFWIALRPDRALGVVLGEDPADSARWVQRLRDTNPELLVVEVSSGWVALTLAGEQARRLAALLPDNPNSAIPIRQPADAPGDDPRIRAGEVAGVPAVVVPIDGGTTILVGASYAHHLASQLGASEPEGPSRTSREPDSARART